MHQMGCKVTDLPFFWCPVCGTTKTCDGDVAVPALVRRCQDFQETIKGQCALHAHEWNRLGIAESIYPPGRMK
jgi:hypothetical protein